MTQFIKKGVCNNNTILFKRALPLSDKETTYSKERSEYEKLGTFLLKQNNAIINPLLGKSAALETLVTVQGHIDNFHLN